MSYQPGIKMFNTTYNRIEDFIEEHIEDIAKKSSDMMVKLLNSPGRLGMVRNMLYDHVDAEEFSGVVSLLIEQKPEVDTLIEKGLRRLLNKAVIYEIACKMEGEIH